MERSCQTRMVSLKFEDITLVNVGRGDNARLFPVHTSRLRDRSTFLAAASSDRWKAARMPAQNTSIDLSEESPFIFDLYLHCIYANTVDLGDLDMFLFKSKSPIIAYNADDEAYNRSFRLYILADKLGDCATANMVIDFIAHHVFTRNQIPGSYYISLILDNCPETSPLRKLIIDLLAYRCPPSIATEIANVETFPKAASAAVWVELLKTRIERLNAMVKDAFDLGSIKKEKDRYHQFDSLHPRPQDAGASDDEE